MLKCTIMLPVSYNDGKHVPQVILDFCLDGFLRIAGGYTALPVSTGVFRMDSGVVCRESVLPIWVAVESKRFPDIQRWCRYIAETLEQECVYLETCAVETYFVKP